MIMRSVHIALKREQFILTFTHLQGRCSQNFEEHVEIVLIYERHHRSSSCLDVGAVARFHQNDVMEKELCHFSWMAMMTAKTTVELSFCSNNAHQMPVVLLCLYVWPKSLKKQQ